MKKTEIHEKNRRPPDYSSNLCPPKIWSIWQKGSPRGALNNTKDWHVISWRLRASRQSIWMLSRCPCWLLRFQCCSQCVSESIYAHPISVPILWAAWPRDLEQDFCGGRERYVCIYIYIYIYTNHAWRNYVRSYSWGSKPDTDTDSLFKLGVFRNKTWHWQNF